MRRSALFVGFILVLSACASPALTPENIVLVATPFASTPTPVATAISVTADAVAVQAWEYTSMTVYTISSKTGVFIEDERSNDCGATRDTDPDAGASCFFLDGNDALTVKLAEMGAEGWELVGVMNGDVYASGRHSAIFFFKRPISP